MVDKAIGKSIIPSMKTKFYPFGLELTYIPGSATGNEDVLYLMDALIENVKKSVRRHEKLGDKFYVDADPHVCEVTTPPYKTTKKMVEDFNRITEIAASHGGVTSAAWTTGGGCHIHVNAFKNKQLNKLVLLDWAYRTAVGYAFNHPCANTHSTSRIIVEDGRMDCVIIPGRTAYFYHIGDHIQSPKVNLALRSLRSRSSGRCIQTIEFRFFRMPDTAEQLVEHAEFVQAYMNKVASLGVTGMTEMLSAKPLPTNPKDCSLKEALATFKETIEWLGLSWEKYRKYEKNIRTRYAYQNCPENGINSYRAHNFLN